MSPTTCHGPDGVDLSHDQAWVLHDALLDHVERTVAAGGSPDHAMDVLERGEACASLDAADRGLAREARTAYLVDPPARDREPAQTALATL
ncbi:hypothetical protein [Haloplanus halobius]|uniref:DUF7853 family protein n=1 Tax=Haloplanus halobius TaxID=2934938 RepID=UPI00200D041B|nr:hypothetical protein [Haloplanus sp. XH21]